MRQPAHGAAGSIQDCRGLMRTIKQKRVLKHIKVEVAFRPVAARLISD